MALVNSLCWMSSGVSGGICCSLLQVTGHCNRAPLDRRCWAAYLLVTHHLLQQGDQHEHDERGEIEGYCTDSQWGKESPYRTEDRFGQVIQDSVEDRHTREPPAAVQRDDEVEHDPAEKDKPVQRQQQ